MSRTRIKICGLTRSQDVDDCLDAGVDALGFVYYPPSPRFVEPESAVALARRVPPFVTRVGLFVNAAEPEVARVLDLGLVDLLQFHGDESAAYCAQFGMPYIKVARMRPGIDLLELAACHEEARALLLDTYVESYGGAGKAFDWSLVSRGLGKPLILSGGLDAGNVGQGIASLTPWAVDVSSGVEAAKGIKDREKIRAFVAAVKEADQNRSNG